MHTGTIRVTLTLAAMLFVLQWSRVAEADVTINGTAGEIGVLTHVIADGGWHGVVRFKFTDLTQTKTCTNTNNGQNQNVGAGYAYIIDSDGGYREVYAALLLSKKGAPISCTITDNLNCRVTTCTLP